MVNQNTFFSDAFEADSTGRRALFESFRPDDLLTGFQRNVFSDMFNRTMNDYLGTLGQSARIGEIQPQTFTEYLSNQDFGRQLKRDNVFETGRQQSPFRSAAQFLFER